LSTGKHCRIGENLKILGEGVVTLGDNVTIGDNVAINVSERLTIGDRSSLGSTFLIEGRDIQIGKEFWSGRFCGIGGGSRFEKTSSLKIGDMCHLGDFGFINTARPVVIGDEVGLGQYSRVYAHGAYQSFLRGFPVEFGPVTLEDRVWCPSAVVMPNVTIGHDTVVGAGAVVTKSLPSGCLAVGIPARVIKENCYPKILQKKEFNHLIKEFLDHFKKDILAPEEVNVANLKLTSSTVFVGKTIFDFKNYSIDGPVTSLAERFKNELRRYGVRFRYYAKDGVYSPW
jgi:acetyltransferase-like isoleucine patch superfamily enzyme